MYLLIIFCLFLICPILQGNGFRLKSYNLNKYTSSEHHLDCLHTVRKVPLPKEFTFCYRHKQLYNGGSWGRKGGSILLANYNHDWTVVKTGIELAYWTNPWIAIHHNRSMAWIKPGEGYGFNMLTWRHTCLAISLLDFSYMMYENGELVKDAQFDEKFRKGLSQPAVDIITVGCAHMPQQFKESHPGIVTDFQLFGTKLSEQKMKDWTGCTERMQGDIVSWDMKEWFFNKTGNGSEIEYLEFEKDVCNMQELSHHIFPTKERFSKSMDQCRKVSAKMNV